VVNSEPAVVIGEINALRHLHDHLFDGRPVLRIRDGSDDGTGGSQFIDCLGPASQEERRKERNEREPNPLPFRPDELSAVVDG
jgi:hypothetical protein